MKLYSSPYYNSLDKEEHENELKQILGETQSSHDIDEDELLIVGTSGILVAGRGCARHEETLVAYLELKSIELFVSAFSERLLYLHDSLHGVHNAIANYERDPSSCGPDHVSNIMTELQDTSRATMRLAETLACLKDSIKNAGGLREPVDDGGKRLFAVLEITEIRDEISRRLDDLGHTMAGAKEELVGVGVFSSLFSLFSLSLSLSLFAHRKSKQDGLRQLSASVRDAQLTKLYDAIKDSSAVMTEVFQATQRGSASLEIVQALIAGMLTFDLMDRVTGTSWSIFEEDWARQTIAVVVKYPAAWLGISLACWVIFSQFTALSFESVRAKEVGKCLIGLAVDDEG